MSAANYLFDLPEDLQTLIYKKVFKDTLKEIESSNNKSLYEFYDIEAKSKLIYYIIDVDNIYLERTYYTLRDNSLGKIEYIEYPIGYLAKQFQYCKTIIEDFAALIYNDDNDERCNLKLQRRHSGIYYVQYNNNNSFRIFIDGNKLLCKIDLEKAIIIGYELLYYSLKLPSILEIIPNDDYDDIEGLYNWIASHNCLDGYDIRKNSVAVVLGC